MITSSFCLCVALVYINVWCRFFCQGTRQEFEGRGVHVESNKRDKMWSLTCSLALYPYRYISSHVVSFEPLHDHQTYVHNHHHHCSSPSPWLRLPLPPCPLGLPPPALPVVPWPVTLAGGAEKQRSASGTRPLCVRDDEEGHLICRSGDVLQERCTHCHYYYYSSTLIS